MSGNLLPLSMISQNDNGIFTIAILDNHPILRMGLAILLRENIRHVIVTEAKNIAEFKETEDQINPDLFILVTNENSDEGNNHHPVEEIKKYYPSAFLIVYGEEALPDVVIDYLKSGINGYLSKYKDLAELIICIDTVMSGKRYLNPGHMEILFSYLIENYRQHKKQDILTPRQYEIAQYLIQGLTTSSIAEKTGLHISTISTFKAAIFLKLGVDNVLKLKLAIEEDDRHKLL